MTFLEAKKGLCRKLGIEWDEIENNDLFTVADIEDYVNEGCIKAWDYSYWNFAEMSKSVSLTATDKTNGYIAYPFDLAPLSINLLKVNGAEFKKYNFRDYQRYLELKPNGTEKIWAEYNQLIFINPNCFTDGSILDIYGKEMFTRLTGDNELLPFSPDVNTELLSGNQAIIILSYAEALSSEKKRNPNQAVIEEKKAYGLLEGLRQQFGKGRATEQSANRPFFNVPDYYRGNNPGGNSSIIGMF